MKNDSSSTSILTSNVSNTPKSIHFPKPFPIPHSWGDVVDSALKKSDVTLNTHNEIVHTLCTSMKMHSINDLHQLSVIV